MLHVMKKHVRKYKQVVPSYGEILEEMADVSVSYIVLCVMFLTEAEKVTSKRSLNKITYN